MPESWHGPTCTHAQPWLSVHCRHVLHKGEPRLSLRWPSPMSTTYLRFCATSNCFASSAFRRCGTCRKDSGRGRIKGQVLANLETDTQQMYKSLSRKPVCFLIIPASRPLGDVQVMRNPLGCFRVVRAYSLDSPLLMRDHSPRHLQTSNMSDFPHLLPPALTNSARLCKAPFVVVE